MQGPSREAAAAAEQRLDRVLAERSEPGQRRELAGALYAVTDLLDRELPLRRTLADPAAPVAARTGLVDRLFGDRLDAAAVELLRAMVAERWSRPVDLVDELDTLGTAAAFAAAEADGVLDEVEDELFRFGRILDREAALHTALSSPQLPAANKAELVRALLSERAQPTTLDVVLRAATAPRGQPVDRALAGYIGLAARRRSRVVATVTSAVSLDPARAARLARALTGLYGREVQLQLEVDPGLRGGLVVRVGDEVLDASVARRLADLRRRLAGRD